MSTAPSTRFARIARPYRRALDAVDNVGDQALFYASALRSVGRAARTYPRETIRALAEISMGTGLLAVIGGSVVIMGFLTLFAGTTVAVQGHSSLGDIGISALTGFLSAYVNVRVVAPVTAGIGLAATIGAGTTAQLGAMRISEEIDALESMAIRPMPYLVGTRVLAGLIAAVPLYSIAVAMSFLAGRVATVRVLGQSAGVYDHYFSTFLIPSDVLWSFAQVLGMTVVVMLIHSYYGYRASGGASGVGTGTGRAVRASLIAVVTITLITSVALYSGARQLHLAG